jgi:hypothetical protein
MSTRSTFRIALAVLLSLPVVLPQAAAALPNQKICRVTTYYKEAALENVVGTRTTCPPKLTGHTSRYFEVETFEIDNPSGPGGGGPGGIPCEFVPDGTGKWDPQNTCQNLPLQRGTVFE